MCCAPANRLSSFARSSLLPQRASLYTTMPLFNKTIVNDDEVKALVKKHWNVDLGEKLKDSQNQTYHATFAGDAKETKAIVRVTPNEGGKRTGTIDLELSVLHFLVTKSLPVCEAYPTLDNGALQVQMGELSVSVFHYAQGDLVEFTKLHWMLDEEKVLGVGRWIGRLHLLLDEYEDAHPELVVHARQWDDLHEGILKEVKVDERDLEIERSKSASKPRAYGLIHGDINTSNYFWMNEEQLPCMFDWDQMQRAWRLYDLTSCIWGVCTLQGAGSPLTMLPVPEANEEQYTNWIVKGYEEATQTTVDRDALARYLKIRRSLYAIFCPRALLELDPSTFMYKFCEFMSKWLSSEPAETKATN